MASLDQFCLELSIDSVLFFLYRYLKPINRYELCFVRIQLIHIILILYVVCFLLIYDLLSWAKFKCAGVVGSTLSFAKALGTEFLLQLVDPMLTPDFIHLIFGPSPSTVSLSTVNQFYGDQMHLNPIWTGSVRVVAKQLKNGLADLHQTS